MHTHFYTTPVGVVPCTPSLFFRSLDPRKVFVHAGTDGAVVQIFKSNLCEAR